MSKPTSGAKLVEGGEIALVSPPRQERSRKSVERIMAAAEEVLLDDAMEFTVINVATAGKLSIGGIYARFRDKNELLEALKDRVVGRHEIAMAEAMRRCAGTSVEAVIDTFVDAMMVHLVVDEKLQRKLFEAARTNASLSVRGRAGREALFETFREAMLKVPALRDDHFRPHLALGYEMLMATWLGRVSGAIRSDFSWDGYAAELKRSAIAYLRAVMASSPALPD